MPINMQPAITAKQAVGENIFCPLNHEPSAAFITFLDLFFESASSISNRWTVPKRGDASSISGSSLSSFSPCDPRLFVRVATRRSTASEITNQKVGVPATNDGPLIGREHERKEASCKVK